MEDVGPIADVPCDGVGRFEANASNALGKTASFTIII